ncbi:hypothetical protein H2198_007594 [Neophaeococcomyces mojaviensis]|uniref:Uncharacterized protein n=1 Tax=Neophaeococcomyces mojaviensis TaxID=3383035 RepID=A0ACC2ZZL8_9EURO|nr:hypothetical protein H2198_007594 [Knufia sp. JES_112]
MRDISGSIAGYTSIPRSSLEAREPKKANKNEKANSVMVIASVGGKKSGAELSRGGGGLTGLLWNDERDVVPQTEEELNGALISFA